MRQLLRVACIVTGLALAMGGAAIAEALGAGDGGAGATDVSAQERARRLRLAEARMQVEAARRALAMAEIDHGKGNVPPPDLAKMQLDIVRAERALAEVEATEKHRISVQLQGIPVQEAFTAIFKDSGESFMLHPDLAKLPHSITLNLKDVGLESAVQMICKLYNLEYDTDSQGLWVIMPGSTFATVAGARVPIIGTVTGVPGLPEGGTELGRRGVRIFTGGRGTGIGLVETPKRPDFVGDDRLVDLDVKDAPLSEVASRLSLKADAPPKEGPPPPGWSERYCDLEIIADDSVKDMKVTAKITKWPLGEVLDMLLAQTGLVCTVDPGTSTSGRRPATVPSFRAERDPVTGELTYTPPPTVTIYLVPAPELRVSGAGWPGLAHLLRGQWPDAEVTKLYKGLADDAKLGADWPGPALAPRKCPECGNAAVLPFWKYCAQCGAKLPEATRPAEKRVKGD